MKLNFDASVNNLDDANDLIDFLALIEKEHSIDCTLNLTMVSCNIFNDYFDDYEVEDDRIAAI